MKQNRISLFLFYWLPFLIWALIIFSFSSKTTHAVSAIHWEDFIIKKTIHLIEYAIFTVLLYRALKKSGFNKKRSLIYSLVGAFSYGATDEFHQSFTPGREPTVRDILIDSFGSFLAVSFIAKVMPILPVEFKKIANKLEI